MLDRRCFLASATATSIGVGVVANRAPATPHPDAGWREEARHLLDQLSDGQLEDLAGLVHDLVALGRA
ncbi:hypothetical protein [Azospirillum sp. TSO22-1]|uniref:hypothetical protein n=1 Tax=Azospirillum sp. TSO22-1 TaxID=716789 RepID=UPI000D61248D|nr:hypothetical protein [Azospirillum sp. TSO22-1]PWC53631.1 hypothetical protein TSO221_10410 [Azospirillum sp. TSO22-1]